MENRREAVIATVTGGSVPIHSLKWTEALGGLFCYFTKVVCPKMRLRYAVMWMTHNYTSQIRPEFLQESLTTVNGYS